MSPPSLNKITIKKKLKLLYCEKSLWIGNKVLSKLDLNNGIVIYRTLLKTALCGYYNEKYNIKTSFVSPDGPKARSNKTGIRFMIFILIFVENCLKYVVMHDFSVWLKTGSNLADIDRLRGDTGITFSFFFTKKSLNREIERCMFCGVYV